MTRAGRARAVGAVLLVLALADACSAEPRTPAPIQASWPGCEAVGAFFDDRGEGPPGVGGVPAGFTPSTVVLCEDGEHENAAGAMVSGELERTSTDVAPLLGYLGQPDERPTNGACPAIAVLPSWLFLLDAAGRYVAPAIPKDECNLPIGWQGGRSAWESLTYSDRLLRETPAGEDDEVRKAGCPKVHDDVVDAYAGSTHRRSGRFTSDPFAGRRLRYCVYDIDGSEPGRDVAPGVLVSGANFVEDERAGVVSALLSAPEAPGPCAETHSSFALVGPRDGGPSLFVELDGCRRAVSDQDSTPVVRAGDDLLALLGG